jgi:hypothetical protein
MKNVFVEAVIFAVVLAVAAIMMNWDLVLDLIAE